MMENYNGQNTRQSQAQQPVEPQPPVAPQPPVYEQYAPQVQPQYVQPPYDPTKEVMSVGSYIGMFILSSIPIVNIICWIVWLVSPNTNKNKKNYCIATIVLWIIGIIISFAATLIASIAGVDLLSSL